MATLCLINFPEFSESKEILKIGRSEVCVWGGGLKVELLFWHYLYIHILSEEIIQHTYIHYKISKYVFLKGTRHLATFWKMSFRHPLGFWKIWYQRNQSQKLERSTKPLFRILDLSSRNPAEHVSGLHRTDRTDYRF